MALTLYFHPLSSFCHKVLIALYENDIAFEPYPINLMEADEAKAFKKLWPIGKFPVLEDRGRTIPESSIIIEHLDLNHPGKTRFIPADPKSALDVRGKDRFFDLHLHLPMQKIVGDKLRPEGSKDAHGLEDARQRLFVALDLAEAEMSNRTWAAGDAFTLADCAAAPPLFYIDRLFSLAGTHKHLAAYLDRLKTRSSYARTLKEAEPYLKMFPF